LGWAVTGLRGAVDGDVPCPVDTGLVSADAAVAVTVAAIAVAIRKPLADASDQYHSIISVHGSHLFVLTTHR